MKMCAEPVERGSFPESESVSRFYLTLPPDLPGCFREYGNVEALLNRFLDYALTVSRTKRRVRVSVRRRRTLADMETFFSISPPGWLQASFECEGGTELAEGAREVLESLGYRCSEWIGVEGSEAQLGAYHAESPQATDLILYAWNRGARRGCEFLMPLLESASAPDHAI